jgi:hypothetical protein
MGADATYTGLLGVLQVAGARALAPLGGNGVQLQLRVRVQVPVAAPQSPRGRSHCPRAQPNPRHVHLPDAPAATPPPLAQGASQTREGRRQ